MWKKWKKRLSSLLIITLIASLCVPQLSVIADTADVIVGDNGTIYDADYEPFIYDEDEWTDDSDDDEEEVAVLAYYDDATPSNATPSNASFASDSNWDLATDSNAMLNIVEFTEPGPFLPASGGISTFRLRRAAASEEADSVKGIHTAKTATANEDGSYTIQLESYVEGNITQTSTTTPVDIVLVLDVSGSMKNCIECGNVVGNNSKHYSYTKVNTAGNLVGGAYYYKTNSGDYARAYYCSGSDSWFDSCNGGWFTEQHTYGYGHYYRGYSLSDTTILFSRSSEQEQCESRMSALQDAVKEFITSVETNAEDNNVDHQIAIVKFAGDMSVEEGNTGANQTYNGNKSYCNHTQIVKNLTNVIQVDQTTNETGADKLIKAVEELSPAGPTRTDFAMTQAKNIIDNIPTERKSQKVVIMFTDGAPSVWDSYSSNVADSSILTSCGIKEQGTTVYTIGVFDGADSTIPMADGLDDDDTNKYMHYVSSNFKYAKSMGDGGTATYPTTGNYYLSAGSSQALSDIFSNISDQIQSGGASIELGTETVVEDVVTPYFELPNGTSDIKVYTSDCTGMVDGNYVFKSSDEYEKPNGVTVNMVEDETDNTTSISVRGFDYTHNFVAASPRAEGDVTDSSGSFYGRKLIIEFTVTPKDGFLGGNNVPTNVSATISSSESDVSKTFEDEPIVNVPIPEFTVTAADKNVYLTNTLAIDELKTGAQIIRTDNGAVITVDLAKDNYGLKSWQNAFVNINPTCDLIDTETEKTAPLTYDTIYTLSVTISPKYVATTQNGIDAIATTEVANGEIVVYKPVITFNDGKVYYGTEIPIDKDLDKLRVDSVLWKHVEEDGREIFVTESKVMDKVMDGDEPTEFDFTYFPDLTKVNTNKVVITKSDVPVRVDDVTIGEVSVDRNQITWLRNKCEDVKNETQVDLTKNNFVLHVKTCDLTINKTFESDADASSDTFVFEIQNEENAAIPVKTTVSITGQDSVTITGLPVGVYSVKEDANWSWRYTCEPKAGTAELTASSDGDSKTISFVNELTNDSWLNHFSAALKNVFGVKQEVSDNE